jgi:hypothetical protein
MTVVDVNHFLYAQGPAGPFTAPAGPSASSGSVITGAFADPNGNVTPSDPSLAAWYYQEGAVPNWWSWNVTSQAWNQQAG